jgi:sulfatase modifying factor 1
MNYQKKIIFIFIILIAISACKKEENKSTKTTNNKELNVPKEMVWVNGKTFLQGAKQSDNFAMPREKPAHEVKVDGFFIDATEVTNKQFKKFVIATKYITIAERPIDWKEMKTHHQ